MATIDDIFKRVGEQGVLMMMHAPLCTGSHWTAQCVKKSSDNEVAAVRWYLENTSIMSPKVINTLF